MATAEVEATTTKEKAAALTAATAARVTETVSMMPKQGEAAEEAMAAETSANVDAEARRAVPASDSQLDEATRQDEARI